MPHGGAANVYAIQMRIIGGRFVVDHSWGPYRGDMSEVVRAVDMENGATPVAVKVFPKDAFQQNFVMEAFSRECESLKRLSSHENIVTLVDIGRDQESGSSYLALEWCDANLLEYVTAHPEPTWEGFHERYGKDILNALCFAYSQDVIHRDIKPQNVLINSSGRACVADFGISKFRRYYRPGVTLAHLKSAPYAPPDDSVEFPDTRDVFSYAVLCLECISGLPFHDYPDVQKALQKVHVPDTIRSILTRCLDGDPALRPSNVILLAEEITGAMSREATMRAITRDVPVHLTNSALDAMRVEGKLSSNDKAATYLFRELNEICAVEEHQSPTMGVDRRISLLTGELRLLAVIDEVAHRLTIIGLSPQSPARLERLRERAWQPLARFLPARPGGDANAIDWFATEFDQFLSDRRVEAEKLAESELFDSWSALLRVKEEIQNSMKAPIRFSASRSDGARLILQAREDYAEGLVGQQRLIHIDARSHIYGEVERTDGEEIILYCGQGQNLDSVPSYGELELDVRQSQIALRRQIGALDAVKFGRSARADLRDIITGKRTPHTPKPDHDTVFFQADLDEDKKAAVRSALGTKDLLLVEGPPGTGKTKFITELVAQVLTKTPDARILLSSQTNVALDHALINIEKLAKHNHVPLRAVRIARRDDEKVSPQLSHLLLERRVATWLSETTQKSEEFLLLWASDHGISAEYVHIGMALADLRATTQRKQIAKERLAELREDLEALEAERLDLEKDRGRGDEFRAVRSDIRIKQGEIDLAEGELESARRVFQIASDRARAFPDLAGQIENLTEAQLTSLEADFINHAQGGDRYRKLLLLVEEWRQRFGQSSDFHGAYIADCDLVGGTCLGVAAHSLQTVEFDLCIIDEASKATPTEMLVPMSKSKKWIIVGDPNQLPPFVDDSLTSRLQLQQQGIGRDELRLTLLDHFIKIAPPESRVSLLTQHRMVKPIGDLVSACFYKGSLKNVNEKVCRWLAKAQALPTPVTWFNTAGSPRRAEAFRRGTYVNDAEVEVIGNLLLRLQLAAAQRKEPYTVALLSGYGGQVAALDRLAVAKQRHLPDLLIESGTVDSYQGREADIAIYSVTRSNSEGKIGFLREHERLNVALSRAKVGLAIIGDAVFCDGVTGQNPFENVLSYMRTHTSDCSFVDVV